MNIYMTQIFVLFSLANFAMMNGSRSLDYSISFNIFPALSYTSLWFIIVCIPFLFYKQQPLQIFWTIGQFLLKRTHNYPNGPSTVDQKVGNEQRLYFYVIFQPKICGTLKEEKYVIPQKAQKALYCKEKWF